MKRITALLLTLAMLLALLAGCGKTTTSAPAAISETEEAAAASVAQETEPIQPEESSLDSSEAISTVEAPKADFDIYGPFHEETLTLTYWKLWPPFLDGYDPMDASLFATLANDLNVTVDVTTVGTDSADTKFNLMVASGDYLDLIENGANNYPGGGTKAVQDEVLVDLMPYMEVYAPDYWAALQKDQVAMKTMVNADNQMASIVSLYDKEPVPQMGMWMRQDWLTEQNLSAPSTLEEMEQVLETFKDQYGCTDAYAVRESCDLPLRNVYDAFEWSVTPEGAVQYGYTDTRDNLREYIQKAHEWYEKGYFSSGFVTANDTNKPQANMVTSGETGAFDADILIVSQVKSLDSTVELTAVAPITRNADDKLPADWSSTMNNSTQCSVSTNCQYVEEAVAYMNYTFTDQAFMAANWGTEGETYTIENGEPVFTDLMLNNPNLPASFTPLAYISPGFPFMKSYDMALSSYSDPAQVACYDIFSSKIDKSLPKTSYPKDFVSFTTEESETIAQYQTDLETYVTECLAKFYTGDMDISEYDAFADKLLEMGSDKIKAVYQDAYDRFTE